MVFLVIHPQADVRQAVHAVLARLGLGPCLTAADAEEIRRLYTTAGPAVAVIVAAAESSDWIAEWRHAVGPVRAAFLAEGDLAEWAARLPGELLLPSDPLPVDALRGWIMALAAENFPPAPSPAPVSAVLPSLAASIAPAANRKPDPAPPPIPAAAPAEGLSATPEAPPPVQPASHASSAILGDYELLEVLREDERSVTYRALQQSVQRTVVLERLRTAFAGDPSAVRAFRSQVRAQAAVVHPQIAAVYEAQELGGQLFYTREWIEGKNMAMLRSQRQRLGQDQILDLLSAAAEAIGWLDTHGIARRAIASSDVVLGRDGLPRIANLAAGSAPPFQDEPGEIRGLVAAAQAILDTSKPAEEFQAVAARVADASPRGLRSWSALSAVLVESRRRAAEARVPHTRRLSAGTQEVITKQRRRQHRMLAVAAGAAALAGVALVRWLPYWNAPEARALDDMVRIPGGPYIYQGGEMRELPDFWISKYEVTLAQYAEFLEEMDRSPGNRHDHPRQPATKKTHRPAEWDSLIQAARKGGRWRGLPVDLNCPVTGVDYWDAWAYAHWRGRRLPTEEEWEKAGRSSDGRLYPWGRDPDAPRANTGADFAEGVGRGEQDGYAGWAPVDAFSESDRSPYGVVGLSGNVSEWTDSTMLHPEVLDQQVPVLRGGSYAVRPTELTHRRPAAGPEAADAATGFRVASDRAP